MKPQEILLATCTTALLVACGGEDSGPSSSPPPSSSSSSSGGCNYADQITAQERSRANACGVQVSANYAQADSGLQSVIAACQQGEKAKADAYYNSTYMQMVSYARSVAKALSCNTSGSSSTTGPTLPDNSKETFYNFCVKQTTVAGKISYEGTCYGPFQQFKGGCPSGYSNNIAQYSSLNACTTAGKAWLNSR